MSKRSTSIIDIDDLKSILRLLSRNWYIPVIAVLVAAGISFIYTHKLTNVHAAQAQILLKNGETYDYQNKIYQNLGYNNYQAYVDNTNEIRVLRSKDLIEKAVRKLKLDVSYFIVGRLKTTEVYEGMPYNVEVLSANPALYKQKVKFKILAEDQYQIEYTKANLPVVKTGTFNKELIDPDCKLLVKKTNAINKNTVESLKEIQYLLQFHNVSDLISRFQSNLKVQIPEYTNILQITVEDALPQRAVTFLDTLMSVYITNSIESNFKVNENTLVFIDRQLTEVTDILSGIEDTMEVYKRKEAILDLTREQEDYFDKLSTFDNTRSRLQLNISALDALEKYIIEDKDPEFLPPSVYINTDDEFLKQNVSELYELQLTKNATLFKATDVSLPIKELNEKISRIKKNLLTYIDNARVALRTKISDVNAQIGGYESSIRRIPKKQRDLLNIQRKMQVNEKMYLFLLEKKSNTIIAKAGIIPNAKVIETAKAIGIVKPDRTRIRIYFILVGVLISIIVIFVRVVFFEKIESLEELKAKTSFPVLGEILESKNDTGNFVIAVEKDSKSPITESFRTIRTNLQYFAADQRSKVVLITSNSPGEGKTFCSINIAAILAKAGKRVLLLELDLHKPKVHIGLNLQSDKGISNILIGQCESKDVVIPSQVENLEVILSGPVPPNASELLLSPSLNKLFDFGRDNYDYVIIDTPPVGLISDAVYMMGMVDISLFVIHTRYVNKNSVNMANEIVETNKVKNFGFLLNGVKRKRSKYYYNRYSYGYGYGYGHGYGYGSSPASNGSSKVKSKT